MLASVVISLALLGPAPSGKPQFTNDDARAHFEAAAGHFGDGDYAAASESLRLAYEAEAIAELLYSRAQVERRLEHWATASELYATYLATNPPEGQADNARAPLLFCRAKAKQIEGNCGEAVPMLESYLQTYPDTSDAASATEALAQCEEDAATEPVDGPSAAIAPVAAPAKDGAPPPVVEVTPWHKDLAGAILVGSGLAIAAAGTAVALAGRAKFIDGTTAPRHSQSVVAMDEGITLERVGIGVAAGGGLVALVGVVRWISVGVRPRRRARSTRAQLTPSAGGLALHW